VVYEGLAISKMLLSFLGRMLLSLAQSIQHKETRHSCWTALIRCRQLTPPIWQHLSTNCHAVINRNAWILD